jgi:phage terminase large subunit
VSQYQNEQRDASRHYRPRGGAKSLFPCRDSEILCAGPAGTGKTRAVLEKVNRWMLKCPGSRALLVRKTRASMTESVLVTYESKVIPENTDLYPDVHSTLRRVRQSYEYPNGSSIVVGGMDNADRIMSTEYDLIAAFEATELTEDDWEKLTTRLRNGVMPFQQAVADCNPAGPGHWLNLRANSGRMTRLLSHHQDNPVLWDGSGWTPRGKVYISRLDALTGTRHARLRLGRWAAAEGLIYPEYDPDIHLIDSFKIPDSWRRIRAIDFGYVHPFVCLWAAFDEDDRMYVYRQWYMSRRLVSDHAGKINALSVGERYECTVTDHDAEDRATLEKILGPTLLARKEVRLGIESVSLRFRKTADRPRLYILRDSLVEKDANLADAKQPTCLEEELECYSWATAPDGKIAKDEPMKVNDDACDALRYACMQRKLSRREGAVILM